MRTLKHDLMAAVEKTEVLYGSLQEIPDSETPYAEILFWALFVGGSLALEPSETTWFAEYVLPYFLSSHIVLIDADYNVY